MSPHRTIAADSTVVAAQSTLGAGVASSLAAILVGWHGFLFAALIGAMLLDLMTGTHRARVNVGEEYDEGRALGGLRSKGRRVALVLLGLIVDTVVVVLSRESGIGVGTIDRGWVTAGVIGWLIRVEGYSILDNVQRTEGKAVIPPHLRVGLDQIAEVPRLPGSMHTGGDA